jgi:hypothetical protein
MVTLLPPSDRSSAPPDRHVGFVRAARSMLVAALAAVALVAWGAEEAAAADPAPDPLESAASVVERLSHRLSPMADPVVDVASRVTAAAAEVAVPAATVLPATARPVRTAAPLGRVTAPLVDAAREVVATADGRVGPIVSPILDTLAPAVEPLRAVADAVGGRLDPVLPEPGIHPGGIVPPVVDEAPGPDAAEPRAPVGESHRARSGASVPVRDRHHAIITQALELVATHPDHIVSVGGDARRTAAHRRESAAGTPVAVTPSEAAPARSGSTGPATSTPASAGTLHGGHGIDPAIGAGIGAIAATVLLVVAWSSFLPRHGLVPAPPVPPG